MNNYQVMLDIETMGTTHNSAIVAIAAVIFDLETGKIIREFDDVVDLNSCLEIGLEVNANTIYWWLSQDKEAINSITKDKGHIRSVLKGLTDFIKSVELDNDAEPIVWSNGRFDFGILSNAYQAIKMKVPWKYWNERDVRTISDLYPSIKKALTFKGTKHNPLDDCKYQVEYLYHTYYVTFDTCLVEDYIKANINQ